MAEKTQDEKLDAIATHIDSLHKRFDAAEDERKSDRARMDATCSRMDAWDEDKKKADAARKDAADKEEKEKADAMKADAARKDAEEKEKEEKAKADAAKKDAEDEEKKKADAAKADAAGTAALRADLDAVKAELKLRPAVLADADKGKYAAVQMRCDAAYQAWGAQATPSMSGESLSDYKVRLLSGIKKHSKVYKDSNLSVLAADDAAFGVIQDAIIQDAIEASNSGVEVGAPLQKRVTRMDSGHVVTKWIGDPSVAWAPFSGGATKFGRINIDMANRR